MTNESIFYIIGLLIGFILGQAVAMWGEIKKRAVWVNQGDGDWSCSKCGEMFTFDAYGDIHPKHDCGCNYCPNCGAKMDGEAVKE